MAKISLANSGKYSSGSTNDFFTLADDGDVARVRFLYEEPDGSDVDYYVVHEVEVDGKKRYAACLAVDDEGDLHPEDCPLCQAGYKRIEKLFLQVYVEDEDKVKTWDRGKTFVAKIMTYINRYGSLVAQPIEIERRGKKNNTNTTYEMFPLQRDDKTVDDFPPKQDLLGTFVLDVTAEECYAILNGTYVVPGAGAHSNEQPTNRREPSRRSSEPKTAGPTTPAPEPEQPNRTSRRGNSAPQSTTFDSAPSAPAAGTRRRRQAANDQF